MHSMDPLIAMTSVARATKKLDWLEPFQRLLTSPITLPVILRHWMQSWTCGLGCRHYFDTSDSDKFGDTSKINLRAIRHST